MSRFDAVDDAELREILLELTSSQINGLVILIDAMHRGMDWVPLRDFLFSLPIEPSYEAVVMPDEEAMDLVQEAQARPGLDPRVQSAWSRCCIEVFMMKDADKVGELKAALRQWIAA